MYQLNNGGPGLTPLDLLVNPGTSLFNLYILSLGQLYSNCNVSHHNYADDSKIYVSMSANMNMKSARFIKVVD